MSDFIIPKGVDYNFTIKVMEDDSFLPQNLDGFDPIGSKLQIISSSTGDATGIEADLTSITEDIIDEVPLVEEVTTLSVLEVTESKYAVTINASEYSVDYSGVNYTITPTNTATLADDVVASFVLTGDDVYDISVISANNMYQVVGNTVTLIADNTPEDFTIAFNYGDQIAIDPTNTTPVTNVPADTSAIATELASVITSGSPLNITAVATTNQIAITETTGAKAIITYTSNLVLSGYIDGTEYVAGGALTYFNDNGYIEGTLLGSATSQLVVERGDEVDGYPLKALYQGVVTVNFSDGTPTKTALIDEVYVTYAGA